MSSGLFQWNRVTSREPCLVCGKPDWCGRTTDGALLRCMRGGETPHAYHVVRSDAEGGTLFGRNEQTPPPPKRRTKPAIDWNARHAEARAEIVPGELGDFADVELGLSGEGVDALEVGVVDDRYVFPERDALGNVIGLVRREADGSKLCLPGSKRGLIYRHPLSPTDPVLVVEGATDTAAAIEAGFNVVGRPSATGGGELLAQLLRDRHVVVVGENDQKPDGTWPGRDGAKRIADRLKPACKSVRIMFPPDDIKDVRGWIGGAR